MYKRTISRIAVIVAASLLFTACPKKENSPPAADTELQSSLDVAWATHVITDIEMTCAFVGVGEFLDHFYHHVDNTPIVNQCETIHSVSERRISTTFNETPCVDGYKRSGEVRVMYEIVDHNPDAYNPTYYHDYKFRGRLTLHDYRINDWLVTTEGARLENQLESSLWDPRATNLKWTLEGKFNFIHPTDPTKNITWEGKLTKELLNTSNNAVYSESHQPAITWSLASVGYYGAIGGLVMGDKPYSMTIDKKEMLVREMTCSPDLLGVAIEDTDLQPVSSEFHPFTKGVAGFVVENKYPRRIFFGNEANNSAPAQCDNTGQILIKGNLFRVNFLK